MMIHELVEMMAASIALSLWCLGFRVSQEPGMLLSSFRQRILKWADKQERIKQLTLQLTLEPDSPNIAKELNKLANRLTWRELLTKPSLTCVTCMPSLHGCLFLVVLYIRGQVTSENLFPMFLSIPASAFINALAWKTFKRT